MEEIKANYANLMPDELSPNAAEQIEENIGSKIDLHQEITDTIPRKASTGLPYGTQNEGILKEERLRAEREENELNEENLREKKLIQVLDCEEYKYIGEIVEDKREGFGVCYYSNGKIYIGEWQNDQINGLGKLIQSNGEILQGDVYQGNFRGYCQLINHKQKFFMEGYYENNHFLGPVIVMSDYKKFEGETITQNNISIGKLTSSKKSNRLFFGEIANYTTESGYGILINKNLNMYIGYIKNKQFRDYIELYSHDGASFFGRLNDKGLKQGLSFSFSKDARVSFGVYEENSRNGPFLHFSNSHNLNKSSVRMELFHFDFRSRVVDKMETSKKYLLMYYPEFCNILNVNYLEVINRLNNVIVEEIAFYQSQNGADNKNIENL
jgi:hypothetical protein